MLTVLQGVRQFQLPVPAHPHPPGHQTLPLRDLSTEVYAALASPAAHQDAHRRQTLQVSPSRVPEGLLATLKPAITFSVPPNGQTVQVQLLLQMLHGRGIPARAHSQAQRVEAPENAHLPILRQVLHAGDVLSQAFTEARREG